MTDARGAGTASHAAVGLRAAAVALVVMGLAACERDFVLEGERFALRAPFAEDAGEVPDNRTLAVALPAQQAHAAWTHRLGAPGQRLSHPALSAEPRLVWSAPIGQGDGRGHRITADPVAEGGRIFTLDSRALVTATSTSGQTIWSRDLRPAYARPDAASGGGLALGEGRLYVTSAFGLLVALDPVTGAELWRHRFDAPVTAAPAVAGGKVFVSVSDSTGWALDAATGKVDWQLPGTPSGSSVAGGAAPAIAGERVVFPMPSGEVIAARRDTGMTVWSTLVGGQRIGIAAAGVTDITGDPVVAGDTIHVGNQSGGMLALDARSGTQRWRADEAAWGPVWPVGDSVFLLSDRNWLIRLEAATGQYVWGNDLGLYREAREGRRAEIYAHYGPVLAGGRLWLAGNDSVLRSFAPDSGALVGAQPLPAAATGTPIVVDRTMYLVTGNGQLHALR